MRALVAALLLAAAALPAGAQTFAAVSIKPADPNQPEIARFPMDEDLPNGGLRLKNSPMSALFGRAFPDVRYVDIAGLPAWVSTELFDIVATPPGPQIPTPDERRAMVRALLADRFGLRFHREDRERPVFRMVVASKDGTLGPSLQPTTECHADNPCRLRNLYVQIDGAATMPELARLLGRYAEYEIIDSTNLAGHYKVSLSFQPKRAPEVPSRPDDRPALADAMRQQLGLRLETARTMKSVLIVDRLERPTAD